MAFRSLLVALVLLASGCAPTGIAVPDTSEVPVGPMVGGAQGHAKLNAVLWTQTAAEYRAIALQSYAAARGALPAALADSTWTAVPEQQAMGGYETLPPAVVLDVDETVLDNSVYEARLIRDGGEFSRETWNEWVAEEAAPAVPGALAFTRAADSLGVTVIYLTNRRGGEEASTRANLAALGFPLAAGFDVVLTRGDLTRTGEPAFDTSDKAPRRAAVAAQFRVLELLGDNLGDFLSGVDGSVEERARLAAPYAGWWGERWFMFPNPQYGSWESTLFDNDYSLSREEKLDRKMEQLRTGGK